MMKIGRNDPCPCGSGRKYKHCCLKQGRRTPPRQAKPPDPSAIQSLIRDAVSGLQEAAARREATFRELGVFLMFSTTGGEAWFLEVTENDAVQVARAGEPMDLPLEAGAEDGTTIVINWSHTFRLIDKELRVTPYDAANEAATLPDAPTLRIAAAIRRIKKRYDEAMLNQVHQTPTDDADSGDDRENADLAAGEETVRPPAAGES